MCGAIDCQCRQMPAAVSRCAFRYLSPQVRAAGQNPAAVRVSVSLSNIASIAGPTLGAKCRYAYAVTLWPRIAPALAVADANVAPANKRGNEFPQLFGMPLCITRALFKQQGACFLVEKLIRPLATRLRL